MLISASSLRLKEDRLKSEEFSEEFNDATAAPMGFENSHVCISLPGKLCHHSCHDDIYYAATGARCSGSQIVEIVRPYIQQRTHLHPARHFSHIWIHQFCFGIA
jgi:hypothetical protein